jgi:hypothetical protein
VSLTYSTVQIGDTTLVTVTSTLTPPVYYYWYLDGQYLGMTTIASRSFRLLVGDQSRVEVVDSNDPSMDPFEYAPEAYPARKTLFWIQSLAADVDHYRIDQQENGGDWGQIAIVPAIATQWSYMFLTARLDDLSSYAWRITPVDSIGNDGAPIEIGPELIVRTPDAPAFTASLNPSTTYLTVTAA